MAATVSVTMVRDAPRVGHNRGVNLTRAAAMATLIAAGLALAACATPAGGPSEAPSEPPTPTPAAETDAATELHAAWLDAGRAVAVVTYGSSTCLPAVEDVQGEGSSVTVVISEPEDGPCTMDYVPRATYIGLPAGVDIDDGLTVVVTGAFEGTVKLDDEDDLTGTPGESTDYAPSAGWFDKTGFVVLTWGSSSCAPGVASVEATGDEALALTFADFPDDQVCTMDMGPRVAVAAVSDGFGDEDDVELTLSGADISGTTTILGDR